MKYKVGDKVRIISDMSTVSDRWKSDMNEYLGTIMTIKEVDDYYKKIYKMVEDREEFCIGFYWWEDMIEGLAEPYIELVLHGIEDGEKFDLVDERGLLHVYGPFYFNNGILYDKHGDNSLSTLGNIILGYYNIRKINTAKQEAQAELDKLLKDAEELRKKIEEM